MVTMGLTKVSSKGQIVIPSEMRNDLKEGEQLIIIKDESRIILKRADKMTKEMKKDLEFARRTEEAWKQIERGEYTFSSKEEFLKKLG
jgi:AbrB family looped-hinge helix DNA binding protein